MITFTKQSDKVWLLKVRTVFRRYINLNIDSSFFFFLSETCLQRLRNWNEVSRRFFFNVPLAEEGIFLRVVSVNVKYGEMPRIKVIPLFKSAKALFHLKNEDIYFYPRGNRTGEVSFITRKALLNRET